MLDDLKAIPYHSLTVACGYDFVVARSHLIFYKLKKGVLMTKTLRRTVLVVDDVTANVDILVEILGDYYDVSVAMDGESALQYLDESTPDLILLDIMMPGIDGYEVLRRIKSMKRCSDIPIIFVTAMGDETDETRGLELGAIDYITKPVSPPIVTARVKNHIELKLARENLKKQNILLQENIRLRDDVERITKHDLKTPLNSILCIPGILTKSMNLDDEQKEMLQFIEKSGYRMLEIINRSLDLYKMETGSYKFRPVTVDIIPLINQIRGEVKELVSVKNLTIEIKSRRENQENWIFMVLGEEMLLYVMLANLVQNAVEASPDRSLVTITLEEAKNSVHVNIHNKGTVPREVRERFFDKYTTSGKKRGTGLGTYSAKLIANSLEGDIGFQTSEETGTTLFVTLPRPPERQSFGKKSTILKKKSVSTPSLYYQKRVLLIDDFRNIRMLVKGILRNLGFQYFVEANNGKKAIKILEENKLDLIVSDWNMPHMTGIELLRYVRLHESIMDTPFLLITAEATRESVEEAIQLGVSDYIVKPFTADILTKKISEIMVGHRLGSI